MTRGLFDDGSILQLHHRSVGVCMLFPILPIFINSFFLIYHRQSAKKRYLKEEILKDRERRRSHATGKLDIGDHCSQPFKAPNSQGMPNADALQTLSCRSAGPVQILVPPLSARDTRRHPLRVKVQPAASPPSPLEPRGGGTLNGGDTKTRLLYLFP
jgi:hypothetical protein